MRSSFTRQSAPLVNRGLRDAETQRALVQLPGERIQIAVPTECIAQCARQIAHLPEYSEAIRGPPTLLGENRIFAALLLSIKQKRRLLERFESLLFVWNRLDVDTAILAERQLVQTAKGCRIVVLPTNGFLGSGE